MEADDATPVDYRAYNLQAKYAEFNSRLFGGELPKIPLSYAKLKGVGGVVNYQIVRPAGVPAPSPLRVKLGLVDQYQGSVLTPGSLRMRIDTTFARNQQEVDGIMIHEMIHVYFAVEGQFGVKHGPPFEAMAKKLSQQVGFEVPLVDEVTHLKIANPSAVKPVGVILLRKSNNAVGFMLWDAKAMEQSIEQIEAQWRRLVPRVAKKVEAALVSSQVWTDMTATYKVQRKVGKQITYYDLTEAAAEMAVADFNAHGRILFTVGE